MIKVKKYGDVIGFKLARTVLGRGLYFTACYLVDGLLIDSGCSYTVNELMAALAGRPVDTVVNTHSHEDHVAANKRLKQERSAVLLAHPVAIPILGDPKKNMSLALYQKVMWGYPEPSTVNPLGEIVETAQYKFQVLYTPGHSQDHVCLYEPGRGWLFTGDLFISGEDKALRDDYDIWKIIDSLKKIARLDIGVMFPGSGNIKERPVHLINRKIQYLEELGEKVLALHGEGLGVKEIRKRLLGREHPIAYWTLGHFSGRHLILSYLKNKRIYN